MLDLMNEKTKALAEEIRKLPQEDQDYLLTSIIHNLDGTPYEEEDGELSPEWKATVERRSREIKDGKVELISMEQTRKRIEETISNARQTAS